MSLSRRDFVVGAAASACGVSGGCIAINNVPLYEAGRDHSLPVPKELAEIGSQIKVRLQGVENLILVWSAKDGFHGVSINCTHRGSEVRWNTTDDTLDCPSHGSRFRTDGTVLEGPAKKPLRAYVVELQDQRLKIMG